MVEKNKEAENEDEEKVQEPSKERVLEQARKEYGLLKKSNFLPGILKQDPKSYKEYIRHALRDIFDIESGQKENDTIEQAVEDIFEEEAKMGNEGCDLELS
jgi:hypothetical protein